MNSSEKESGVVKFFKSDKGFGFIKPNNGGDDLFFHITQVQEGQEPKSLDNVEYTVGQGKKGVAAVNVQIV